MTPPRPLARALARRLVGLSLVSLAPACAGDPPGDLVVTPLASHAGGPQNTGAAASGGASGAAASGSAPGAAASGSAPGAVGGSHGNTHAGFPGSDPPAGPGGAPPTAGASGSTGGVSGASAGGSSASLGGSGGASNTGASGGSSSGASGASTSTGGAGGQPPPGPCTTRVTYGDRWVHPPDHPEQHDVVEGVVDWDGTCIDDGPSSYAVLSNGWKPIFEGHGGCVIALDRSPSCPDAGACATRITYGPAWQPPPDHPAQHDDVPGRVFDDGICATDGGTSFTTLSNGWKPHFDGPGACHVSLRYTQCDGLYANPVMPVGCPDPGVLREGSTYVMACTTPGGGGGAFPLWVSSDLASWSPAGQVFPWGTTPAWSTDSYWAPEVHRVGDRHVAYFTARHADGRLAIGAATSTTGPLGPFVDAGQPLVHEPDEGVIDATYFFDGATNFLIWKTDGNASGQPTPLWGQALSPDGTQRVGERVLLMTNDQPWEGAVTEAPWLVAHGGAYYLFYSGAFYFDASYAVGVARAPSPLGPYEKLPWPIVATNPAWVGPGHASVVEGPGGGSFLVYHAWRPGQVNLNGDDRFVLVDAIVWGDDGWPRVPGAPSWRSRPMP